MIRFLQQPYPFGGPLRPKLLQNAVIGAFVAFFLIAFQPFGTSEWDSPNKNWYLLGYGFVSFLGPTMVHILMFVWSNREQWEKNWTIGYDILLQVLILIAIALGNMLYGNILSTTQISFSALITWLGIVALVGIFPLTAGILFRHGRYLALNQQDAAVLEANLQHFRAETATFVPLMEEQLIFLAENEKDQIVLLTADLLYVESADNYANFVFLKGGKVQKMLLRGPLKRFEDQIGSNKSITRCHRSFIVNLAQVEHVSGNAQGYRLSLRNLEITVPVARNYGAEVLGRLRAGLSA